MCVLLSACVDQIKLTPSCSAFLVSRASFLASNSAWMLSLRLITACTKRPAVSAHAKYKDKHNEEKLLGQAVGSMPDPGVWIPMDHWSQTGNAAVPLNERTALRVFGVQL